MLAASDVALKSPAAASGDAHVEDFQRGMWPAGGDRGSAVLVGVRRRIRRGVGLMGAVQVGAGQKLVELITVPDPG
jgi:hypothetical protein